MSSHAEEILASTLKALKVARALETTAAGVDRETRLAATAAVERLEERVRTLRYLIQHPPHEVRP